MEFKVCLKTENNNLFNLYLHAFNKRAAKSKAKRLSKGCTVVSVDEMDEGEPNRRKDVSLT